MARGANRDAVARFLDEVALVFRDMMTGDRAMYVNSEIAGSIEKMSSAWNVAALPTIIDHISEARSRVLLGNMNIDATLADLFMQVRRAR
jgi:hypothetical protein